MDISGRFKGFAAESAKSIVSKTFKMPCSPISKHQISQIISFNLNKAQQDKSNKPRHSPKNTNIDESQPNDLNGNAFNLLKIGVDEAEKHLYIVEHLLKEKEILVNDLEQTTKSQIKLISDLKLDNENINVKYEDELKNREHVGQKMSKLWTSVEALKTNSNILKERYEKFEDFESAITDFTNIYSKEVEDLKNKFVSINEIYEENCNQLRTQIDDEFQLRKAAEEKLGVGNKLFEEKMTNLRDECDNRIKELLQTIEGLKEKMNEEMEKQAQLETEKNIKLTEMNETCEELKIQNDTLAKEKNDILAELESVKEQSKTNLDVVNVQLHDEKDRTLKLEETLKTRETKLAENEIQFSKLTNEIAELEIKIAENDSKISSMISARTALESQIDEFKETKIEMESTISKLNCINDERQQVIDKNNLEMKECKANLDYAKEAKEDLEKQVTSLSKENENSKKSCEYLENLCSGIKFDMRLQEQKLSTTINNLYEKIKQQKDEYAKLLKANEERELKIKQQKNLDTKITNDLRLLTKKQEDEIKMLKETNQTQITEINDLKQKIQLSEKPKRKVATRTTTKKISTKCTTILNKEIRKRTTPANNRKIFTPTDDTNDTDVENGTVVSSQGSQTTRKRVTFSPVISSFADIEENNIDNIFASPKSANKKKCLTAITAPTSKVNETCYGTPIRTRSATTITSPKKPAKLEDDKENNGTQWLDADDVFKFTGE